MSTVVARCALDPHAWASAVSARAGRRAARRGRRRPRPRARARHARLRPRRGRLPPPGPRLPRGVRRRVRAARRRRRRLLRRQGLPLASRSPAGSHEEGLRVDTATGGELAVALRAGIPGADIGLHGNNKSDSEIERALAAGVGRIIVDSLDRGRAGRGRRRSAAAARPGHGPGHHRRARGRARVHLDGARGPEVRPVARRRSGDPRGASRAAARRAGPVLRAARHPLATSARRSSTRPASRWRPATCSAARDLTRRTGVLVAEIDLGGGYGIAYLPARRRSTRRSSPSVVAATVADVRTSSARPAAHLDRAGPRDRRPDDVHALHRRHRQARRRRRRDGPSTAHVRLGRRRHERQPPARALRRRTTPRRSRRASAAPGRCSRGSSASTARAATSSCTTSSCPATSRRATSWPSRCTGAYGRSMASNYNLGAATARAGGARRRRARPRAARDRGRPARARPGVTGFRASTVRPRPGPARPPRALPPRALSRRLSTDLRVVPARLSVGLGRLRTDVRSDPEEVATVLMAATSSPGGSRAAAAAEAMTRSVEVLVGLVPEAAGWSGPERHALLGWADRVLAAVTVFRAGLLVGEREAGTWQGAGDRSFEAFRVRTRGGSRGRRRCRSARRSTWRRPRRRRPR